MCWMLKGTQTRNVLFTMVNNEPHLCATYGSFGSSEVFTPIAKRTHHAIKPRM